MVVAVLLAAVAEQGGAASVEAVLAAAGEPRSVRQLADLDGWTSPEQARALFEAAAAVLGDPDIARRAGERAFAVPGNPLPALLRALPDPASALLFIADHMAVRASFGELTCAHVAAGSALLTLRVGPEVRPSRAMCEYLAGVVATVPTLFGIPPAAVEEPTCQARGDASCGFTVRWEAAATATATATVPRGTTSSGPLLDGPSLDRPSLDRPSLGGPPPGAASRAALGTLLAFGHELATVTDPIAVADRLAAAVGVLCAAGAVVLGWDDRSDRLVEAGRAGRRRAPEAGTVGVAACGDLLRRLDRRGRPLPLRARSTEPALDDLCRLAGFGDGFVVPLRAHGASYGVLLVEATGGDGQVLATAMAAARMASAALARGDLRTRCARQAAEDPVTGLPGTGTLRSLAEPVLGTARRLGGRGALVVVDIDGLAAANAAHGRQGGDRLLAAAADLLREALRDADSVARVGDDEFAVLLPGVSSDEEAETVATRLRAACDTTVGLGDTWWPLSVSVGVARVGPDDAFDRLLARAERSLADGRRAAGAVLGARAVAGGPLS